MSVKGECEVWSVKGEGSVVGVRSRFPDGNDRQKGNGNRKDNDKDGC